MVDSTDVKKQPHSSGLDFRLDVTLSCLLILIKNIFSRSIIEKLLNRALRREKTGKHDKFLKGMLKWSYTEEITPLLDYEHTLQESAMFYRLEILLFLYYLLSFERTKAVFNKVTVNIVNSIHFH